MKRILSLILLTTLCSILMVESADATELYKGHGRRLRDYSWSWRASGSVGFQGVEDPWDQFGVSSFPIGGYANFGLEFALLDRQSLEFSGGYNWVNDAQNVVRIEGPPELPRPGTYRYEVDAWSAGATWRYSVTTGSSASYLGLGGGWVFGSSLRYEEDIEGSEPYELRASGSGPEVHIVFGYEGVPRPGIRMGVELGYRYSWVDFDNGVYGAGNFNGIYLGFRMGFTRGGRSD